MDRNNLNNVTTQDSLENLKRLIESRNFDQARLTITALKDAKNITNEEIKRRLIQLRTDNQAFTFFFDNYERVNTQPPVEPSAPPAPQEFMGELPSPKSPNKKLPNNKNKSGLPVIRRRSSGLRNSLSSSKSLNKKRPSNKKKSGLPVITRRPSLKRRLSSSKSLNKKRPSNKKKSGLPVITRRPSLKRKLSSSEKGNKQTKKRKL